MKHVSLILIAALSSAFASVSAAVDMTKEEVYTCTEGNDPSEGVVSVYLKDGTSLFRGDALVKSGHILSIGGVITSSRVEAPTIRGEATKAAGNSAPNALTARAGDQVSRIEPVGQTVGRSELRPGDKVPPQTGAALGQPSVAYFDAGITTNGELRSVRWQSWKKEANGAVIPKSTAIEPMAPSHSEDEMQYLKSAQMYLTQFKRYVSCCDNPNLAFCKTVERAPQPLQPIEVPATQPSYSTQSPFR